MLRPSSRRQVETSLKSNTCTIRTRISRTRFWRWPKRSTTRTKLRGRRMLGGSSEPSKSRAGAISRSAWQRLTFPSRTRPSERAAHRDTPSRSQTCGHLWERGSSTRYRARSLPCPVFPAVRDSSMSTSTAISPVSSHRPMRSCVSSSTSSLPARL